MEPAYGTYSRAAHLSVFPSPFFVLWSLYRSPYALIWVLLPSARAEVGLTISMVAGAHEWTALHPLEATSFAFLA